LHQDVNFSFRTATKLANALKMDSFPELRPQEADRDRMRYSAAYPTMRRKSFALEGSLAEGEPEGPARGRARSVSFSG
jgi:hypothetical protein